MGAVLVLGHVVIKEISPHSLLPKMVVLHTTSYPIGHTTAYVISALTSSELIPIIYQMIISAITLILFLFVFTNETPKYLVMSNREEESLMVMNHFFEKHEEIERQFAQLQVFASNARYKLPSYKDLFTRSYCFAFIHCCMLFAARNWSGFLTYLSYYPTTLINHPVSDEGKQFSGIIMGAYSVLWCVASYHLINWISRNRLTGIGSTVMGLANMGLFLCYYFDNRSVGHYDLLRLVFFVLYESSLWLSLGVIPWVYCVEVLHERGIAASMMVYYLTTMLLSLAFNIAKQDSQFERFEGMCITGAFLVFSILGMFVGFFGMIDTNEKSEEDISKLIVMGFFATKSRNVSRDNTLSSFNIDPVSYTHLRAHETSLHLVCRLLLEKKKKHHQNTDAAI
eukprot:TRINITY_DN45471_c0_g1_i1.p1 TRINITY_DN45471_c0_g1~~TRINITY_DN45471_c0_g1_i1.p1  ORF type:complete len:396 (+),score=34.28 TRINITY_DN45471_c0_g1_i1:2-1189(+)